MHGDCLHVDISISFNYFTVKTLLSYLCIFHKKKFLNLIELTPFLPFPVYFHFDRSGLVRADNTNWYTFLDMFQCAGKTHKNVTVLCRNYKNSILLILCVDWLNDHFLIYWQSRCSCYMTIAKLVIISSSKLSSLYSPVLFSGSLVKCGRRNFLYAKSRYCCKK